MINLPQIVYEGKKGKKALLSHADRHHVG